MTICTHTSPLRREPYLCALCSIEELQDEVQRLQRALHFWLPHVPAKGSHEALTRVGDDAMLLVGYDPTDPVELDAEARGWITLNAAQK